MTLITENFLNTLSNKVGNANQAVKAGVVDSSLAARNFANTVSNKVGNLSTNQKTGLGAGIAASLTAGGLAYMDSELNHEPDKFMEKFDEISKHPTLQIKADSMTALRDGDLTLDKVLADETKVMDQDGNYITLSDAKDHVINSEKLKALHRMAPGVIAGAGAVGAIGARIGSTRPTKG